MNQRWLPDESRVKVLLNWEDIQGRTVSQKNFIQKIGQLSIDQGLKPLITLLQYGDAKDPPCYDELDRYITQLFPTTTGFQIERRLSQPDPHIFFSRWQLLFAIKLLCAFGSSETSESPVSEEELLQLLLMTNSFYPQGTPNRASSSDTSQVLEIMQITALLGYSLIQSEHPQHLIGRYAELFGRLASPDNQNEFRSWVDLQAAMENQIGTNLATFKAVVFLLSIQSVKGTSWPDDGQARPQRGLLVPKDYFDMLKLPQEEFERALNLVTTCPAEIRDEHRSVYGESIGNPIDVHGLLRKPAIKLPDGSVAGLSGELLIQRYTCGLYWDIHDALPSDTDKGPNRQDFQTFFGELHERYGSDTLLRIRDAQSEQKRKVRLLAEADYLSDTGKNPDNLLIETIGSRNVRCTLFEFKVGRPRYKDTILEADLQAFHKDLHLKVEEGLNQEIDFCRQVQAGHRQIANLSVNNITAWFFVIVVTDPFPSMSILLEPLHQQLGDASGLGDAKRYGPFILSLAELEQLETLPKRRVSELLINWSKGPHRDWPFNTFFAHCTKGVPTRNNHVSTLAQADLERTVATLLGGPTYGLQRGSTDN